MIRSHCLYIVVFVILISMTTGVSAQTLEPRAYSNAPVGMNFLLLAYQNSKGALLFDPAIPITDANAKIDMGLLAYVRTLDVAGKSAKAGVILPYASLYADGYLSGNFRSRDTDGLADPAFYFSMNFLWCACCFDGRVQELSARHHHRFYT